MQGLSLSSTYLSDDTVGVDDKQSTQRNTLLFNQDTIVLAQLVILVAQQWNVYLAQSAVSPARICPRQQTVFAIGACKDDLCAPRCKVAGALAEGDDLGRTYKGPGHGHEAEDEPLFRRRELCQAQVCAAA